MSFQEKSKTKRPNVEKINKIDAILWEMKYFKLISDEKKDALAGTHDQHLLTKIAEKKEAKLISYNIC